MADDFDRDDVITGIDWRWTGVPVNVLGLHWSILVGFPLLFITQLSRWTLIAWLLYIAFTIWVSVRRRLTPPAYLRMLTTKYLQGGSWTVR